MIALHCVDFTRKWALAAAGCTFQCQRVVVVSMYFVGRFFRSLSQSSTRAKTCDNNFFFFLRIGRWQWREFCCYFRNEMT